LSRTGQLISNLFAEARDAKGGGGATAVPLNGNQPLSAAPLSAQDLLPQLKQAIAQSGMFYESHQAEWVEGRFTKAALLQEPQGKLSSPTALASATGPEFGNAMPSKAIPGAGDPVATLRLSETAPTTDAGKTSTTLASAPSPQLSTPASTPGQLIAPQAQALVQQQLDALATQNFSWQGQIWPGQEMRWEIDEDAARGDTGDSGGDETAAQWATRLHLTLPNLGQVDAQIRLQGNQITLVMTAGSAPTRELMRAAGVALRSQLNEAGITLASMGVTAAETSHGQAPQ